MYSFKDFMVVSYTQSGDELIDYQAYKRKRDMDSGEITASNDPEVDEAMTMQQRQKAKQTFRKNKAKILRGREKANKKMASNEKLKGRARKQARNLLIKKLIKDKDKGDLSFGARQSLEKQIDKKKGAIDRIAKKLLPQVRKADRSKFGTQSGGSAQ